MENASQLKAHHFHAMILTWVLFYFFNNKLGNKNCTIMMTHIKDILFDLSGKKKQLTM